MYICSKIKNRISDARDFKILRNNHKNFLNKRTQSTHFHAIYGEYSGLFDIQTLEMIEGDLPSKAQALIKEWAAMYKTDIMNMWDNKVSKKLPPLS